MHKIVRIAVVSAVILLALIAIAAAQNGAASAFGDGNSVPVQTDGTVQVIGGDEAGLRELLGWLVGGWLDLDQQPIVYVGSLSDKLPFDLLLPDDVRLIGSIFYGDPGYTQIILDVAMTPSAVIDFFRNSLKGDMWKVTEGYPGNSLFSGFVNERSAAESFCYNTGQARVVISAQGQEAVSKVRLLIETPGSLRACISNGSIDLPFALLPQLQTPTGVELLPGEGSGNGGSGLSGYRSGSISAPLRSALPLVDIAEAYNQQLVEAGWAAAGTEVGDNMAWSGWTLTDSDGNLYAGTLTLTANPSTDGDFLAQVIVQEIAAK